jgi:predicted ester cyclase
VSDNDLNIFADALGLCALMWRISRFCWNYLSEFLSGLFKAFPDMQTKIEHIVAENDLVVVFLNGSGTHTGEFRGKSPTNKRVNIRSADLYKIKTKKL